MMTDDTRTEAVGPAGKAMDKAQTTAGGAKDRRKRDGMTSSTTDASVVTSPISLAPLETNEPLVGEERVIPLLTEEIAFSRRKVDRAVVRVATVTQARPTVVDEQLTHERVEVERIAINRMIDAVPPIREEGDITIISVVEEIVVVERRLLLKEEVRLRKVRVTEQHLETIVLRDQDVVVTRTALDHGHALADTPKSTSNPG